ncbi:TetR family transcriptional regulator [Flavisphingomonas formosensis]|uniref:TetR family transcriptional regulator n=1 Tax=Flavisphingomonas formosensis TaxID=861534 RepID=UPI0012FA8A76|nr:TetR family transcriptional regulator [Sphingomonas formosensis]
MAIKRTRLRAADSRVAALEAAKSLLLDQGPRAVTLKAVAQRVDRTHANLLHHFGSAAGLQKALVGHLTSAIIEAIGAAVEDARRGTISYEQVVDLIFDAFGREGAAALVYALMIEGDSAPIDLIIDSIHGLVSRLNEGAAGRPLPQMAVMLVHAAIGDALIGDKLTERLGLPRDIGRALVLEQLAAMQQIPPED